MPASDPFLDAIEHQANILGVVSRLYLSRDCEWLWRKLKPLTRGTWCRAACVSCENCLLDWGALSRDEQTGLVVALENMKDFFDEAGA